MCAKCLKFDNLCAKMTRYIMSGPIHTVHEHYNLTFLGGKKHEFS